jgi:threonine aldolase
VAAPVDLRSDTVTRPTPEMRRAMAEAEVGDDHYGEDPTVARLEELVAARLGYPAAVFVPSGTMANQIALRILGRPGTEVLCAARAHVRQYEAAAAAQNAFVQLRALPDPGGVFTGADVEAVVADSAHHLPPVSAVCIENTHMPASGRPWTAADVADVVAAADRHGLLVHCDGARILHAAVALEVPAPTLTVGVATTMTCMSKGLSAPVGSVLCGSGPLIDAAREQRLRLGGAMRQAGVIAAAAVVAIERMVDRLADDHARAARLAAHLADRFPGSIDPVDVRTNVVCCDGAALPPGFLDALAGHGVLAGMIDASTARFVLHHDVDDDGLARALAAIDAVAVAGTPAPVPG